MQFGALASKSNALFEIQRGLHWCKEARECVTLFDAEIKQIILCRLVYSYFVIFRHPICKILSFAFITLLLFLFLLLCLACTNQLVPILFQFFLLRRIIKVIRGKNSKFCQVETWYKWGFFCVDLFLLVEFRKLSGRGRHNPLLMQWMWFCWYSRISMALSLLLQFEHICSLLTCSKK